MQKTRLLSLAFALACLVGPGGAADFSDPTWPCVQRKVERLSVGLMWPHPIEEIALSEQAEADVHNLVGRFALRRLELEEITPALAGVGLVRAEPVLKVNVRQIGAQSIGQHPFNRPPV